MAYAELLKKELDAGFSKSELERLIGLPKNCLSNILSGKKQLSKKSKLKVDKWLIGTKPDPLDKKTIKEMQVALNKLNAALPASGTYIDLKTVVEVAKNTKKEEFFIDPAPVMKLLNELEPLPQKVVKAKISEAPEPEKKQSMADYLKSEEAKSASSGPVSKADRLKSFRTSK